MLSSVGLVRMGWRIEDVIVIWERVVERRWRGGERESLYRLHEDGFSGVRRIVPCTNLNIDILKSHVIQAQRHTLDRLQIRF